MSDSDMDSRWYHKKAIELRYIIPSIKMELATMYLMGLNDAGKIGSQDMGIGYKGAQSRNISFTLLDDSLFETVDATLKREFGAIGAYTTPVRKVKFL